MGREKRSGINVAIVVYLVVRRVRERKHRG